MKKRILAISLSICLSLGMFSGFGVRVSAEDYQSPPGQSTEQEQNSVDEQTQIGENTDNNAETDNGTENSGSTNNEENASEEQEKVPGDEEQASEDNIQAQDKKEIVTSVEIQCMDEEGNIYYITDDVSPDVKSVEFRSRAANDYVVNLRVKKNGTAVKDGETTNYTEYETGEAGYLYGLMGSDAAYLGTENGNVKFMISGVIGLVAESEVKLVSRNSVGTVSSYYADGTYIVHKICTNMNSASTSSLRVGLQQSYMKTGTTYYSYDGHYFYTDYSVMLSDYRNNTRKQSINPNNPYYNYYQFLPMRSTTSYSASELSNMINAKTNNTSKMWNLGTSLVNNQNAYGVNALLTAGLAANESAWGTSNIAREKNNIFGLNAVDSSPGESASSYASPDACVKNFVEGWMSKRYLNPNNPNYYGSFLGNKASGLNVKYASDPYWGEKAANIVWNLDSARKDMSKYTIGVKDVSGTTHTDLNIRKDSSVSSAGLFTTGKQTGQAFIILGEANGFYKLQSDPVLNSGRTAIDNSSGKYNFSSMYVFASKDYLTVVNGKVSQGGSDSSGGSDNSGGNNPQNPDADTLAVRRGNTYYIKYSLSDGPADLTVPYGKASDEVLIGDWDGDGVDTLCVRRGNVYYFKNSLSEGQADSVVTYGRKNDEVLVGDWNGDGKDTLCVRRGNTYYIKNSISDGIADLTIPYGRANDSVLVGDWDGDGVDTLCVHRGNAYYIKNSLLSGAADATILYGRSADKILVGDWNGDGKDTLCVRRDNAYHIKNSISDGNADLIVYYGRKTDITYAGKWK